ncbi:MAG: hypothetical protein JRJ73_07995 [Deltaproteobacteria bacterium]|nr:hypothetical protein [Deltaproteobacteria bacterium]
MAEMYVRRGGRAFLDAFIKHLLECIKVLEKPTFIVLEGGRGQSLQSEAIRQEMQEKYNQAGIMAFPSFSTAARALFNMSQYQDYLSSHKY